MCQEQAIALFVRGGILASAFRSLIPTPSVPCHVSSRRQSPRANQTFGVQKFRISHVCEAHTGNCRGEITKYVGFRVNAATIEFLRARLQKLACPSFPSFSPFINMTHTPAIIQYSYCLNNLPPAEPHNSAGNTRLRVSRSDCGHMLAKVLLKNRRDEALVWALPGLMLAP